MLKVTGHYINIQKLLIELSIWSQFCLKYVVYIIIKTNKINVILLLSLSVIEQCFSVSATNFDTRLFRKKYTTNPPCISSYEYRLHFRTVSLRKKFYNLLSLLLSNNYMNILRIPSAINFLVSPIGGAVVHPPLRDGGPAHSLSEAGLLLLILPHRRSCCSSSLTGGSAAHSLSQAELLLILSHRRSCCSLYLAGGSAAYSLSQAGLLLILPHRRIYCSFSHRQSCCSFSLTGVVAAHSSSHAKLLFNLPHRQSCCSFSFTGGAVAHSPSQGELLLILPHRRSFCTFSLTGGAAAYSPSQAECYQCSHTSPSRAC